MLRFVFYVVWCAATVLMLIPGNEMPTAFQFWDKAQHALAFFVLTGLAIVSAWMQAQMARVAGAMLIYGGAIEIVQAFLPWRTGDFNDWIADAVGVFCFVIVAHFFPALKIRIKPASRPTSI